MLSPHEISAPRAYRPYADLPVEGMVAEHPRWLRRLIRAANWAAGLAVCGLLPVCVMIWRGVL